MAEAEQLLETQQQLYSDMRVTVQPLVLSLPGNSVVAYNATRFMAESLVKALDLCFKLTHVC